MEEYHRFERNRIASGVPDKGDTTERKSMAIATATIEMQPSTLASIKDGLVLSNCNILETARAFSSLASKKIHCILPMSNPVPLASIDIDFTYPSDRELMIWVTGRNSVENSAEMESLSVASVVALAICLMCDPHNREMCIKRVRIETRSGGFSSSFVPEDSAL